MVTQNVHRSRQTRLRGLCFTRHYCGYKSRGYILCAKPVTFTAIYPHEGGGSSPGGFPVTAGKSRKAQATWIQLLSKHACTILIFSSGPAFAFEIVRLTMHCKKETVFGFVIIHNLLKQEPIYLQGEGVGLQSQVSLTWIHEFISVKDYNSILRFVEYFASILRHRHKLVQTIQKNQPIFLPIKLRFKMYVFFFFFFFFLVFFFFLHLETKKILVELPFIILKTFGTLGRILASNLKKKLTTPLIFIAGCRRVRCVVHVWINCKLILTGSLDCTCIASLSYTALIVKSWFASGKQVTFPNSLTG